MNNFVRNPQVIWDQVDGNTVLCRLDTGDFFDVDIVGSLIWEACDACTLNDIVEQVYERHPNSKKEQLRQEVKRFLLSLEEEGLLECHE